MTQPTITALRKQITKTAETVDRVKATTQDTADEAAARQASASAPNGEGK